jgi:tetratricopeptide (TPR) repeat protein
MFEPLRSFLPALFIAAIAAVSFGQIKDPIDAADQLYVGRQYAQAAEAYQKLFAETTDVPTKAKIKFNLGLTFRMLNQYDRSIESFKEVLAMEVDDREPGGHIMELYRNYRPRAQWEIGNSLFAKGNYDEALAAFRTARGKYKVHSGCGTCSESIERRNNLVEGITLETLGRYSQAVVLYLKADEPHLAEMYFKAGQLDDLRAIVEKNVADLMQKHSWRRDYAIQNSPYRNLIALINAYDLEKAENWKELIKLAHVYARSRDFGRNNVPAVILARHTDKILPLLKNEVGGFSLVSQMGVIYEILALSGKDDPVALLKQMLAKHGLGHENFFVLARTYRLADEKGKKLLRELKPFVDSSPYALFFLERDDIDEFGRFEIKFPRIGEMPKLPRGIEIPSQAP